MKYRIKQFINAITAKITNEDMDFVHKYLTQEEIKLFEKLSVSEQKHCIMVAIDIKEACKEESLNEKRMIKVALLHDIGKIKVRLTPIDKSVFVLLNKFSNGRLKNFDNIKKINVFYNHGKLGYELLKKYNYDEEFLELIKNHHSEETEENNKELNILKKFDDKN